MRKAVVLLSGGLDSATCLFWAKSKGYKPHALLFDYGQRHVTELKRAALVAKAAVAPCQTVKFSLPWGGSALVGKRGRIPHGRKISDMGRGIPSTYVPARNTLFLSFALSYADAVGAEAIIIGANAVDYSGYPDCRPNYLAAMQRAARLGTRRGSTGKPLRLLSPLVRLSKKQIIRLGLKLKVPYHLTWSCYEGGARPCGVCDSCLLRAKGFEEAGLKDPAL